MYILITAVIVAALASSFFRVKHEIKKSRLKFKEFDEAIERNSRAFDQLNTILFAQGDTFATSSARLIELYSERQLSYSRHRLAFELSRPESRLVSYRSSLEPRYDRTPHDQLFNGKFEYCEPLTT
jgi:hypothetical protein